MKNLSLPCFRSSKTKKKPEVIQNFEQYKNFPLAQSMLQEEKTRTESLVKESSFVHNGVKANDSYMRTILVIKERAIEKFVVPWFLVTLNATIIALLQHKVPLKVEWEVPNISMVTSTLGTCLAFLLVFRLNRSAVRWWTTRQMWGDIVRDARVLVSAILENMTPDSPKERDLATAWVCAFVIASKDYLSGYKAMKSEQLAGILTSKQVEVLQKELMRGNHPALFAASELRHVLKISTRVYSSTETSIAIQCTSDMKHYERYIHSLITNVGGMERIRSTPLPIVYVTHLRTFLFLFLLSMPYVYGNAWDWWCIPYVSVIAYLLLGIDGAASECEIPFSNERANHLNMSAYCLLALRNIQQLVVHSADMHSVAKYNVVEDERLDMKSCESSEDLRDDNV